MTNHPIVEPFEIGARFSRSSLTSQNLVYSWTIEKCGETSFAFLLSKVSLHMHDT